MGQSYKDLNNMKTNDIKILQKEKYLEFISIKNKIDKLASDLHDIEIEYNKITKILNDRLEI